MSSTSSCIMLILALDTTTRSGSIALWQDGAVIGCYEDRSGCTHAQRLPEDLVTLLGRHGRTLSDVDLFAVAAGPGSFTGLRIGIATIQGLAFAHHRRVVGVSALEALLWLGLRLAGEGLIAAWIDAQRREVFSTLADPSNTTDSAAGEMRVVEGPAVGAPAETLARWAPRLAGRHAWFIGDGAVTYRHLLDARSGTGLHLVEPAPPLAPAIASIAARRSARGEAVHPHAVRPLYVRRPDAELARDRGGRTR
jgi:tRNA threonylcarbamoyladenosine biosynthesis protein TsaB